MPIPTGPRPFDRLARDLIAAQLAARPTLGTNLGLTEYDGELPDLGASAVADVERDEDRWLDRFTALDAADLTPDEQVDRDLVVMALTGRRVMRDWADWRRNPDHYAGTALSGVFTLMLHRLRPEPELAEAVTARLRAIPGLLAQGVANLAPELASPILLRRSLGQVRAGAAYARAVAGELPEPHRGGVAEAGERAAEAFERFAAHLEGLADRARGEWAIGEERYDALLRHAEGLRYGAREMREKGRTACAALEADIRRRTRELRGHDDWRALAEELDEDHPATPEEMRQAYADITAQARQFCRDRGLVTLPADEECRVVPSAPFTRPVLAVAHYIAPPPFSDRRTGHFFVPFPPDGATSVAVRQRLAANSFRSMWTITAHEAYPGHHWHLSHVAATSGRPLRAVFSSTYFSEGWGLYAEELMREQGFFTDPTHEMGQVAARLFRAARIVVDTSLHLGEMTVEEAVTFMAERAGLPDETARAEVQRYCAWPTQAASYLTGALEIARMRDAWLSQRRGDLLHFHDRIAATGRLPITLVERCLAG
ncbi:MAG: DUF885 domain-containing protein [Carbonactinosporaceae bacterium]